MKGTQGYEMRHMQAESRETAYKEKERRDQSQHTNTYNANSRTCRCFIHSQHSMITTHQQVQRKLKYVKGKNTSHTSHSLHSHAREKQRVPRSQTRIRVAIPRVNPGSEPVQPPRLAGVWTVADTHTGMAWNATRTRCALVIPVVCE